MQFININGCNIHYEYKKQAPDTILFINSLGTDFRIWDEVVAALGHEFSTVRFDKMGHGLSDLQPKPYEIKDYAADVVALLDALQLKKVILVGLSIGGIIGQYLALNEPERIEKLVLSNTAPKVGNDDGWNTRINIVENKGIAAIADTVMKVWFAEEFHQYHSDKLKGYKSMLTNSNTEGYVIACKALKINDLTNEISKINIPTLCIVGTEDGSTPPASVKAMADKITDAQYICIDNTGHIPCAEKPELYADILRKFINKNTAWVGLELGMKTRRSVLGDAHVDRAEANKTDFDKDFQEYITHAAWGAVWSRPHLTKRERSMITIAILTALKLEEELEMHIKATKNTGATEQDVKEVLLHTGVYAGVPVTNGAMKIAKKIYKE
jgi:3-oxoadipate enol-lactonase / 4-carboxymuconolactone decarboxylase